MSLLAESSFPEHFATLTDPSLHAAVCWHTCAHPSLDALGKIVFLADKLDPRKAPATPTNPG